MSETSSNCVKSSDVIGVSVINSSNEKLGKIEEIVLDKNSGQTKYVVLSFGGMLGMGNKYFAFPWKSISYSKDEKSFILNVDKENLKNASGFDKDTWPDMAEWPNTIDKQYM